MRVQIHPEKSITGNYLDYTVVAAVENLIINMSILERVEVEPIERADGSTDHSFAGLKTILHRIRKKTGIAVRIRTTPDYCIIQRVK